MECVRVIRDKNETTEVAGSDFEVTGATVIVAAGPAPGHSDDTKYRSPAGEVRLRANFYTGRTSEKGVFAAGDATTGARSVIHAAAGGKRTALAVDAWLRGRSARARGKTF